MRLEILAAEDEHALRDVPRRGPRDEDAGPAVAAGLFDADGAAVIFLTARRPLAGRLSAPDRDRLS